jgi:2-methylcitrate dehydratase PrpD
MSDIADKIYAATGLTLNAEAAAAIGQMIQAENEKLRAALTNAAAVIGSLYAFAETADAVSISGVARCHAMLTSMKKNRKRIEETIMKPARAALGEKE